MFFVLFNFCILHPFSLLFVLLLFFLFRFSRLVAFVAVEGTGCLLAFHILSAFFLPQRKQASSTLMLRPMLLTFTLDMLYVYCSHCCCSIHEKYPHTLFNKRLHIPQKFNFNFISLSNSKSNLFHRRGKSSFYLVQMLLDYFFELFLVPHINADRQHHQILHQPFPLNRIILLHFATFHFHLITSRSFSSSSSSILSPRLLRNRHH